jgi:hypothetical protein
LGLPAPDLPLANDIPLQLRPLMRAG